MEDKDLKIKMLENSIGLLMRNIDQLIQLSTIKENTLTQYELIHVTLRAENERLKVLTKQFLEKKGYTQADIEEFETELIVNKEPPPKNS